MIAGFKSKAKKTLKNADKEREKSVLLDSFCDIVQTVRSKKQTCIENTREQTTVFSCTLLLKDDR